ncbi:unnamed protein product, partial [marine sediment metagenome]
EFSNRDLLHKAFTHSSAVDNRLFSNERLEFLGDSILGMVICQDLFERFHDYLEGDLTQIKSMLVSRRACAKIIKQLSLQKFLRVGKGMNGSRALVGSLAAGVMESLIAAIYIDGGFEAARSFILRMFDSLIEQANAEQVRGNFKSMLQQYAQQHLNLTPIYEMLDEKGPDHDKCFEVEAVVGVRRFPSAWGTNKKDAEQKAAFNALVELGIVPTASPQQSD